MSKGKREVITGGMSKNPTPHRLQEQKGGVDAFIMSAGSIDISHGDEIQWL